MFWLQFYIYLPKILDLKSRAKEIAAMFNIPCEVSEFYIVSKIIAYLYVQMAKFMAVMYLIGSVEHSDPLCTYL